MPWQNHSKMSLKLEFAKLADQDDANMSALCRRFDITRPTGYKWLARYREEGREGLEERSRRPNESPNQTPEHIEEAVCEVRNRHPAWGGRKIRGRLHTRAEGGEFSFGPEEVPAGSTCQAIIKRNGLVDSESDRHRKAFERFEKAEPNALWQMDFKGHFPLVGEDRRCHPLTIVDDHSRFAIGLEACPNEQRETVKTRLTALFKRYGLPRRILCDNSLPWGVPTADRAGRPLYTKLNAWLFRLGVDVIHGQPYHPETQGKCERFHRSLREEVLQHGSYQALTECQTDFDQWRSTYNLERPHEALSTESGELDVPSGHYQPSERPFPSKLPEISYPAAEHVRTVSAGGQIRFAGEQFYVGEAFGGDPVAVRPEKLRPQEPQQNEAGETVSGGKASKQKWAVYYCHKKVHVIESNPPDQ
jgi:transposase InsO family protein